MALKLALVMWEGGGATGEGGTWTTSDGGNIHVLMHGVYNNEALLYIVGR